MRFVTGPDFSQAADYHQNSALQFAEKLLLREICNRARSSVVPQQLKTKHIRSAEGVRVAPGVGAKRIQITKSEFFSTLFSPSAHRGREGF
jgi:hypothetical protein